MLSWKPFLSEFIASWMSVAPTPLGMQLFTCRGIVRSFIGLPVSWSARSISSLEL